MKTTKICSKCKIPYPATREFFSTASKASGSTLHSWCKSCQRKRGQEQTPYLNEKRRVRVIKDPLKTRGQRLRNGMVTRSRILGIPFDDRLTSVYLSDWLRKTPRCPCCGTDFLTDYKNLRKPLPNSPTVERIYPERGYVLGNVALICFRCNTLKRDATIEELEKVVAWMKTVQR